MMSELIRGWREAWGQGEFPFLFIQKPSGGGCAWSNDNPITRNGNSFVASPSQVPRNGSGKGRYLYVQLMHDNPNSWMVPVSDLGSGVHPTNKWGYGNRAAKVALSQVYKTGVQAYGPIYRSHVVKGNQVIVFVRPSWPRACCGAQRPPSRICCRRQRRQMALGNRQDCGRQRRPVLR